MVTFLVGVFFPALLFKVVLLPVTNALLDALLDETGLGVVVLVVVVVVSLVVGAGVVVFGTKAGKNYGSSVKLTLEV